MNSPLVSVIIPTYKRSEFLPRAIQSVLDQTYRNIEIIIVDDNDGDNYYRENTRFVLEQRFEKVAFKYLKHEKNKGQAAARNRGIKESFGEFIAFLDDDDEWLPTKLEKQVKLIQSLPEDYGIVSCGWNLIHSVNNYNREVYPKARGDLRKILGVNHFSPPSMVVVKKKYLDQVEGFDECLVPSEDTELYYRLSFLCKFNFVPEILVNYNYHENSISRNFPLKLKAVKLFLKKHQSSLKKNWRPYSEVLERQGDLAASSGDTVLAIRSFILAFLFRPLRFQILIKTILSFLSKENYVKYRRL
jgi:glycosyltransferase involved in cell wall biosynthesis